MDDVSVQMRYHWMFFRHLQAYKKYIQRIDNSEPGLPGMSNFTADQIFFLSFAQVSRKQYIVTKLLQVGFLKFDSKNMYLSFLKSRSL